MKNHSVARAYPRTELERQQEIDLLRTLPPAVRALIDRMAPWLALTKNATAVALGFGRELVRVREILEEIERGTGDEIQSR